MSPLLARFGAEIMNDELSIALATAFVNNDHSSETVQNIRLLMSLSAVSNGEEDAVEKTEGFDFQ